MVKQEVTDKELLDGVAKLIDTYGSEIEEKAREFITCFALRERDDVSTFDILMQTYDELGVLKEGNVYSEFISLLDDIFGINQNIIEIGGGIFSRLGHRIAEAQEAGKVVVYDPKLVMKKHSVNNLVLKKELFGHDTDLDGSRMLVGISPCEATQIMIDRACQENLDFLISLCPCCLPEDVREDIYIYDFDYSLRQFKKYLLDDVNKQVRNSSVGKLEIVQLEKCGSPLPVIYNKR